MEENKLIVYPEDVNETIKLTNGQVINQIDIWNYCIYFADNIQLMIGDNIYDGMPLGVFGDKIEKNQKEHLKILFKFVQDKRIYHFQKVMETKYSIRVNAFALCTLCEFINAIIHKIYPSTFNIYFIIIENGFNNIHNLRINNIAIFMI
jgi:hypothetical protein